MVLAFLQTWKVDAQYRRFGDMSAQMAKHLATELKAVPQNRWVIIWPGKSLLIASGWGEQILPFSVQPPFAATDLYSNLRVVEYPDMSCCGVGEWWRRIAPELNAEFARPPEEKISIHVLSWDDSSGAFARENRSIPRRIFVDCVAGVLGGPPDSIDDIDEDKGTRLVKALTDLGKNASENPLAFRQPGGH